MLDKRRFNDNLLYHDMPQEEQYEWFGYSRNKFLHNIDTFYYSVKFRNDFRLKTSDAHVLKMRRFFKLQYDYLNNNEDQPELYRITGRGGAVRSLQEGAAAAAGSPFLRLLPPYFFLFVISIFIFSSLIKGLSWNPALMRFSTILQVSYASRSLRECAKKYIPRYFISFTHWSQLTSYKNTIVKHPASVRHSRISVHWERIGFANR